VESGFSRQVFCRETVAQYNIWNDKDIRTDNKPMFYETFFKSGIRYVTDLWFDLNITESYNIITKKR